MINVKLSPRLEAVSSYVKDDSKIIDIGCDHAFLDIYLYKNRNNIKIIASDVNEKALQNAKANIHKYNLDNKIDTRLGSGLTVLNDEDIDTIILAGMGSFTMLKILNHDLLKKNSIKQIIVQSNTDLYLLRKEVIKKGFYIKNEQVIKENNLYYVIINFERGKRKYSKKELYLGPCLIKENTPIFIEKKTKELNKLKTIYKKIPWYHIFLKIKIKKLIRLYK